MENTKKIDEATDKFNAAMLHLETSLLEAFREYDDEHSAWAEAMKKSRAKVLDHLVAIEERVLNLETRQGPGAH